MDALFWQRMHGGATHFPIVLLLASVIFDFIAWRSRDEGFRRGLHLAGFSSAIVGVLGGFGAVISGLVMSRGEMLGSGYEKFHHLFVWPAFSLSVACISWRILKHGKISRRGFAIYLAGVGISSALMMGAGYWGGEMLLSEETQDSPATTPTSTTNKIVTADQTTLVAAGRQLFLLNCAHCHAPDASGDEGPDLHGEKKSDARIASMIKNGVKGEMPKFGAKLDDAEVQALIAFIHSFH